MEVGLVSYDSGFFSEFMHACMCVSNLFNKVEQNDHVISSSGRVCCL